MTDQELMQSSHEDQVFWLKCVNGLPGLEGFSGTGYDAKGERIPWGSGPHNVVAYREIAEMVKPKSIFEIGFNIGYSAAMWLELTEAEYLFSIDISDKEETIKASQILKDRYGKRFDFLSIDSYTFKVNPAFDMAFIDGGHSEHNVTYDLKMCVQANIKWLVMDDWQPNFGPGVQISVAKFDLEVVKVWGNTALCLNRKV
jgi:hypothetical protein